VQLVPQVLQVQMETITTQHQQKQKQLLQRMEHFQLLLLIQMWIILLVNLQSLHMTLIHT